MRLLSGVIFALLSFVASAHHNELVNSRVVHDLFHLVIDVSVFIMLGSFIYVFIKKLYKKYDLL